MKFVRGFSVLLVLCGFGLSLVAQIAPPPTGKLSWDLFQEAIAGQRTKAGGQPVPVVSALLTTARPVTEGDLATLRGLGYRVQGAFGRFVLVEAPADLYADSEKGVGVLDFVSNASLPPFQIESSSAAVTDGTVTIRAEAAWAGGYRGQGQKVAVIDSGYDPTNATLRQMNPTYYFVVPSGEAPGGYTTAEGRAGERSPHGTSCAIIVGDVAPEAELYLLSYPVGTSILGWLCALHFAVHGLGVTVVSTSVEFSRPTCHADGTGPLNELVNGILKDTEAVLVIASGNWAAGSGADRWFYRGTFADSDGTYQHDFTNSTEEWNRNTLRFEARKGMSISIILEWDDWRSDVHSLDLDLYLYDADFKQLLAQSRTQQYGQTTDPYEIVSGQLPYTGPYAIVIEDRAARWHGEKPRPVSFHLYVHCFNGTFPHVEHHTACGSVREVATNHGAWVIAVGAVAVEDGTLRRYSSRGPTASGYNCPLLLAPDGVRGTVYYPVFYGTSASAPYVAGTIALLHSTKRVLTRSDLVTLLRGSVVTTRDDCGNPIYTIDAALAIENALSK